MHIVSLLSWKLRCWQDMATLFQHARTSKYWARWGISRYPSSVAEDGQVFNGGNRPRGWSLDSWSIRCGFSNAGSSCTQVSAGRLGIVSGRRNPGRTETDNFQGNNEKISFQLSVVSFYSIHRLCLTFYKTISHLVTWWSRSFLFWTQRNTD